MKARFLVTAVGLVIAGWASTGLAQVSGSKPAILNETATALGGAERIRAVKNITRCSCAHARKSIRIGAYTGSFPARP